MPSTQSDVNTIWKQYLQNNDEHLFTDVILMIRPRIISHLRKLIPDVNTINDIVSETEIVLWQKKHTFNDQYSFTTWCFNIARNTAITHFRKKKRECRIFSNTLCSNSNIPIPEASNFFSDRDLIIIRNSISEMPEHLKMVFVRHYIHQRLIREISCETGLKISTVKARLVASRKWAQDFIRKNNIDISL